MSTVSCAAKKPGDLAFRPDQICDRRQPQDSQGDRPRRAAMLLAQADEVIE